MEGTAIEYFTNSIDPGINEREYEFHSYISDDNEQDSCDSHAHMFHLLNKLFDSGILVCVMSILWEDTDGCAKQYMRDLAIHLMAVISSSYGIIMDHAISAPDHGNNVQQTNVT